MVRRLDRLVGRDAELSVVLDAIAAALSGSGRAVLLEGEPGICETPLARSAIEMSGAMPLAGVRSATGAIETLGVLLEALGDRPRLRARAGGAARFGVRQTLLARFDELCSAGRRGRLLEDLHWADGASLELLDALARTRCGTGPRVCTARRSPCSGGLDRLVTSLTRWAPLGRIDLASSAPVDCPELSAALLGARVGPLPATHVGYLGVPTTVAEHLLRASPGPADVERVADVASCLHPSAPSSAALLLKVELDSLGPDDDRRVRAETEQVLALSPPVPSSRRRRGPGCSRPGLPVGAGRTARRLPRAIPAPPRSQGRGRCRGSSARGGAPPARDTPRAHRAAAAGGNRPVIARARRRRGHLAGGGGRLAEADALLPRRARTPPPTAPGRRTSPWSTRSTRSLPSTGSGSPMPVKRSGARRVAEEPCSAPGAHLAPSISSGVTLVAGEPDDAVAELETELALVDEIGAGWHAAGVA